MKSQFIICALSFSLGSSAQCDKNVIYNSAKADFVDSAGNTIHSKEGKITVTLTKKDFVLMHDDDEGDALRGDIKNFTCEWKDAWKNGVTTFESELIEKSGEKNDAMVRIEGQDGHLLIRVNFKRRNTTLKIIPTSYNEGKEWL